MPLKIVFPLVIKRMIKWTAQTVTPYGIVEMGAMFRSRITQTQTNKYTYKPNIPTKILLIGI